MNIPEGKEQDYKQLMDKMDREGIPQHCQHSLASYILDRTPTGDFLKNLISNNLRETFASADDINFSCIKNYVRFLYNYAPSTCWGSTESYYKWVNSRGVWKNARKEENGTP